MTRYRNIGSGNGRLLIFYNLLSERVGNFLSLILKKIGPTGNLVDFRISKVKQVSRSKIINVSVVFLDGSTQLIDLYVGPLIFWPKKSQGQKDSRRTSSLLPSCIFESRRLRDKKSET